MLESGRKTTPVQAWLYAENLPTSSRLPQLNTRTSFSRLTKARNLPSGEKANAVGERGPAPISLLAFFVFKSKKKRSLSYVPMATVQLSGEKASESTSWG